MIYAIRVKHQPFVKIGWTADGALNSRMHNLQLACPYELEVMATSPGNRPEERDLHTRLKRAGMHHRGEWFKLDGETLLVIAEMKTKPQERYVSRKDIQKQRVMERKNEAAIAVVDIAYARDPVAARRQERVDWWHSRGIAAE